MAIRREDERLRAFVLLFAENRSPIVDDLVAYRRRDWFPSTASSAVRRPPAPRSWSWRSDRIRPIPRPEACRRTLLRRTSGRFPGQNCGGMAALPHGIVAIARVRGWMKPRLKPAVSAPKPRLLHLRRAVGAVEAVGQRPPAHGRHRHFHVQVCFRRNGVSLRTATSTAHGRCWQDAGSRRRKPSLSRITVCRRLQTIDDTPIQPILDVTADVKNPGRRATLRTHKERTPVRSPVAAASWGQTASSWQRPHGAPSPWDSRRRR